MGRVSPAPAQLLQGDSCRRRDVGECGGEPIQPTRRCGCRCGRA
ncbi:MAG: hypothetical protein ACK56F_28210 [bacterium]